MSAPASRVVVFGSDTGVGKTLVTAALARTALQAGREVRVLKPVQTGAGEDDDAAVVNRLCGAPIARTGWRLGPPLAPIVAARLEGAELVPDDVVAWIEAGSAGSDRAVATPAQASPAAAAAAPLTLVETAGGCAVELAEGFDMSAMASRCGGSAVVVCRAGLGTLNHAVLTVEHLHAAGVDTLGIVVNGFPATPGLAERTNPAELARLTGLPVLGVVPWLDPVPAPLAGAGEWLAPALGGSFDLVDFLGALASSG